MSLEYLLLFLLVLFACGYTCHKVGQGVGIRDSVTYFIKEGLLHVEEEEEEPTL